MLDAYVFVVHSAKCPYKKNKLYRKCRCRKWIYEYGARRRYSAKTRSWEQAEKLITGEVEEDSSMTVKAAVSDFLSDKREQNISDEWLDKLTHELEKALLPWCEKSGIVHLSNLRLEQLKEYRRAMTGNALTRAKKQERLRSFFLYCQRHGWIRDNPAALLSRIKVDRVPTDFFTEEEFAKVLDAVNIYHARGGEIEKARQRARAFILLLRWSGLRLGDAARLERKRLGADDKLFLYMSKTGEPVSVKLPPAVAQELRDWKGPNPNYFFWTGNGDRKTVVSDWQRTLYRIFAHAKLGKRAHAHMFRDTFAVHMLSKGVPLETVSKLLGHSTVKITEKHYAPWCKARQDLMDEAVMKSWVANK